MDDSQRQMYVERLFAQEDDVLRHIQSESVRNDLPTISVQPQDGRLLYLLVKSVGARKAVEVGTLGGYSGTWIARALPADGKLYTLEKSSKHARVAQSAFAHAGLSDQVELLEGDALVMLEKLTAKGPFDFVFIDADKGGYPRYMEWAIHALRPGGMLAAHNAFRDGRVFSPENDDDRAMARFNESLASDPRLDSTIIAVGDGMAVAIKKR